MSAETATFFITGGTMGQDTPSYVERRADTELYEGLSRGEFCYVLTARQMGKSSLMVRTAARLRDGGHTVVTLDLTTVGRNLSLEQWYYGLLTLMGGQLERRAELRRCWAEHADLSPVQRFMTAVREVALGDCAGRAESPAARARSLVVFIDEIDSVLSLPFSTDEFFVAVRECYNRRAEDAAMGGLTFCLLGVASPADLIQDPRTTPFNVGRRVELHDFGSAEAAPLAIGLQLGTAVAPLRSRTTADRLLRRVMYWTAGQPYLTQRLCRAVAEDPQAHDERGVDRVCRRLFLEPGARDRDDNLYFVQKRLVGRENETAGYLELYRKVRSGRRVPADETNPRIPVLKLSGLVRVSRGRLQVRNRIYHRVFDGTWIQTNLPDAELRRQLAAYRRGVMRTVLTLAGAIGTVAFGWSTVTQRRLSHALERAGGRARYVADMQIAQRAMEKGEYATAASLLAAHEPKAGQEDLRGFEWFYFSRLTRGERATIHRHGIPVQDLAFDGGGTRLTLAEGDGSVRVVGLERQAATLLSEGHVAGASWGAFGYYSTPAVSGNGAVVAHAFSPSEGPTSPFVGWQVAVRTVPGGKVHRFAMGSGRPTQLALSNEGTLVAVAAEGAKRSEIRLWDASTGRPRASVPVTSSSVASLRFSRRGELLLTGPEPGIRRFDPSRSRFLAPLTGVAGKVVLVAEARRAPVMAAVTRRSSAGSGGSRIHLFDLRQRLTPVAQCSSPDRIEVAAVSPDGKRLAVGTRNGSLVLYNLPSLRETGRAYAHPGGVSALTFSPSQDLLVSSGSDRVTRLWKPVLGRDLLFTAHDQPVYSLAITRDGATLATAAVDGQVRLWELSSGNRLAELTGDIPAHSVLAPDGATLGVWQRGALRLRSLRRRGETRLPVETQRVTALSSASADGSAAAGLADGSVHLWKFPAGEPAGRISGRVPLYRLQLSADGQWLIGSGVSGGVSLWNVREARLVAQYPTPQAGPVALSSDGRLLAWGEGNHAVLLDREEGRKVRLSAHVAGIDCLVFSPDGKTLATGGRDEFVALWSVAAGLQAATLSGCPTGVRALNFAPGGEALIAGRFDGRVRLWQALASRQR